MPWLVYLPECVNGACYVGSTNDVENGFIRPVAGDASGRTRRHPPVRSVFREGQAALEAAVPRGRQLKGWKKAEKLALADGSFSGLKQLARSHAGASALPSKPRFDRIRATT